MVKVFHSYSHLDKRHSYSIVVEHREAHAMAWNYWLWFYVGREMKENEFHLLPYEATYDGAKLLKQYQKIHAASKVAAWAVGAIRKHKNRSNSGKKIKIL